MVFVRFILIAMLAFGASMCARTVQPTAATSTVDGKKAAQEFATLSATVTNAIKDMTDGKEGKYLKSLSAIFSNLGPLMSVFSGLLNLGFLFAFGGQDSAELQYMKTEFPKVHAALRSIESGINELKTNIDFRIKEAEMFDSEDKVIQTYEDLEDTFDHPGQSSQNYFLSYFKLRDAERAVDQIARHIKGEHSSGQQLFQLFKKQVKCHVPKIMRYQARILQNVIMGCTIVEAYYSYNASQAGTADAKSFAEKKIADMKEQFSSLKSYFEVVTPECIRDWKVYAPKDLTELVEKPENILMGHEPFANMTKAFFDAKYPKYWWIVTSYNEVGGAQLNHIYGSNYVLSLRNGGRNVIMQYSRRDRPEISETKYAKVNNLMHHMFEDWNGEFGMLNRCVHRTIQVMIDDAMKKFQSNGITEISTILGIRAKAAYTALDPGRHVYLKKKNADCDFRFGQIVISFE